MMRLLSFVRLLACASLLLGAVPRHVATADYWGGYAGTKNVPAPIAARWLSWAETGPPESRELAPLGVRTILYSNPHRQMPGDPMYTGDESSYAHDCNGGRVGGESSHPGLVLMDPQSASTRRLWRAYVDSHQSVGHFDAVFEDEAVGNAYAAGAPCGYSAENWLRSVVDEQRALGYPVIYNGLNDFYNHGVAREITLNATAIGGMMEECYAQLGAQPRVGGWEWNATEETELRMARERKDFFCYGRDLTPADQAYDSRLYTYASFLLTYDPATSILWEYYKTPTGGHVMPESQLVALDPVMHDPSGIDGLRSGDGTYVREYRSCYIAARPVGPCAAAVNPDAGAAHALGLRGYRHTLRLDGSGIFDGGTVRTDGDAPPSSLAPLTGIIALK